MEASNMPSKPKKKLMSKEDVIKIGPEILAKYQDVRKEEYMMLFTDLRLKTFSEWPFDEGNSCNPQALAEAGFFHIPTNESPDAAMCFCCFKELDGWEPDDDPWEEHKKHSEHCAFLALTNPVEKLTVEQLLKLECERQKNKLRKYFHMKKQEVQSLADITRAEMAKLV